MHDPNNNYYPTDNQSGWDNNGYNNSISDSGSGWGVRDNSWTTDSITDPYAENPYEVNVFDNAYTETFSNPNPTHDYANNSGFELD